MKKILLIIIGFISLSLGLIGILLPVLPTTPFVLLSLLCFARGSDKLTNWLTGTSLYQKHLKKYAERKGLTILQKVLILLLSSAMMTVSLILIDNIILRIILAALIVIHILVFIFKIKTIKPDKDNKNNN